MILTVKKGYACGSLGDARGSVMVSSLSDVAPTCSNMYMYVEGGLREFCQTRMFDSMSVVSNRRVGRWNKNRQVGVFVEGL